MKNLPNSEILKMTLAFKKVLKFWNYVNIKFLQDGSFCVEFNFNDLFLASHETKRVIIIIK